jgi:hypothetical protein
VKPLLNALPLTSEDSAICEQLFNSCVLGFPYLESDRRGAALMLFHMRLSQSIAIELPLLRATRLGLLYRRFAT